MRVPGLLLVLLTGAVAMGGESDAADESTTVSLATGQDSIMAWHTSGRKARVNVFSAQDTRRPLIGTHVYFQRSAPDMLLQLRSVFDFVTVDQHAEWIVDALESAQLPWVKIFHNSIPVGNWERSRWKSSETLSDRLYQIRQESKYCLGFNTGSEPHFSPDFHYTGHTKEQVESLIVKPESSKEFGSWMKSLYGDESPTGDRNGDGISFSKDFQFGTDNWDSVGTALPETSPYRRFLQTLFKEYLITQVIIGIDKNYHGTHSDKLIVVSRLLSIPYAPTFGQSLRQLRYPADAVGVTHYVFKHVGEKNLRGTDGDRFALFDPSIVEFASSCIYQQGLRVGRRPYYNEFQCGSREGNTPDNIWRAVFHELQFKPAAINWFAFSAGNDWEWFNCRPVLAELSVLRGQLELMSPYKQIQRQRRDLGIFIPPANPDSTSSTRYASVEGEQWKILQPVARDLTKYGPDILLTDQFDQYEHYDNLIIVLGYIDGPTDAWLSRFLKNPPKDKKILVLCSKTRLFCDPGRRASRDFTHSLIDILPVSPMGGSAAPVFVEKVAGGKVELSVTPNVHRNPNAAKGEWILAGERTVGWKNVHLMVLAGVPVNGCDALVESFFDLKPSAVRSAGMLHILNRDATAAAPGCYCLESSQSLTIPSDLIAFDLPRRKPVQGIVSEPGVIRVLKSNELHVVDCGTAQVRVKGEAADSVRLQVAMPHASFPKTIPCELIISSPHKPSVRLNNRARTVDRIADTSFYRCALTEDGDCVVSK